MKKPKIFLMGFIILWVVVFAVIWGITLLKKGQFKKPPATSSEMMGMAGETGSDMPQGQEAAGEAIAVRCYKIGLTDFKDDLPIMGTVKGAVEIELKFEVNGVVDSINFREGDMVYKGDLIAVLDKKDAKLKVEYSRSKLDVAKTQSLAAKKKLEIHRNLYEIGSIIKAKLEEVELESKAAEEQAKSADVELRSAEAELKKTDLYAPREGVLGSRDVEVGEFITPQNKVGTLYDVKEVFVELGIVENDIDKIAPGQKVIVTVDAHPGMTFNGAVDYIFPVIEGKSRTLTIRVKIQNPDAMLLPGMFSRAIVTVAEFQNAIVVPSMSLNKTDDGYKVFVVDAGNKVKARPVNVEYVTTDYSVIGQGLSVGELIVTETPQELKDDMPVEIVEIQEPAATDNETSRPSN
ncbi:MAG: efflux RND transporter periplasmic adaptor subunit [Candidatus Omnitrophota bacterium]